MFPKRSFNELQKENEMLIAMSGILALLIVAVLQLGDIHKCLERLVEIGEEKKKKEG